MYVDDQYRGPIINEKNHLAGQLTRLTQACNIDNLAGKSTGKLMIPGALQPLHTALTLIWLNQL